MEPKIELPGINPDRVKTKKVIKEEITQPLERFKEIEVVTEKEIPPQTLLFFDWQDKMKRFLRWTAVGTALMIAGTNIGEERKIGGKNEMSDKNKIEDTLRTTEMGVLVDKIQNSIQNIDIDFMHRFTTKDEEGNSQFNPGAIVVPFAVELSTNNKIKTDIEINIPYHFARTFKEISAKNPEAREQLINKLSNLIKNEVENQVVIRGIAGITDTTMVYNAKKDIIVAGKPVIDLNKLDISDIKFTGHASAEAEKSVVNAGAESLTGANIENIELAANRLGDSYEIIISAMKKTGLDEKQIANIKKVSIEHNLTDADCSRLAEISRQVLGQTIGSDKEAAYELVQELNKGNSEVVKQINQNSEYLHAIEDFITSKRGVTLNFNASVDQKKSQVFNIPVLLPLFLLLFPKINIQRIPGTTIPETNKIIIEVPDEIRFTEKAVAVSRRLFSEKTPAVLDKERDFNNIYDSINLSENSEKAYLMLQHLLIEEVYPSLFAETKEPLIDYEEVVKKCWPMQKSDTKINEVRKGSYSTIEEMQRQITQELLRMWEKHDAETYPMQGIDLKTVLNYAHSEDVVCWAKTLAEKFTLMIGQSKSKEDFRELLLAQIKQAHLSRANQGGADRNKFIVSSI